MTIRIRDIITEEDWIKISILLVVAAGCWVWVYREYQKPITTPAWNDALEVKAQN